MPQKKQEIIGKMIAYLIEENFSVAHLNALVAIITSFNQCKAAETEVFVFAAGLYSKYGSDARPAAKGERCSKTN